MDILELCEGLKQVRFKSGEIMLAEGARLEHLYILVEGQVEIIREKTQVTHADEPGSVFGEMSVLLDMPHTATVKALSDVVVYDVPDAIAFLEERPQLALHIATILARRLYYTTSYLVDLQQQAAGKRQDLDIVDEILSQLVEPQAGRKRSRR